MAPHPMYSVGYAGYYGISMMAASYNVLFISIVAHAAQFAFLIYVENPHIEKTYNPPPPRKRELTPSDIQLANSSATTSRDSLENSESSGTMAKFPTFETQPLSVHDLIGLKNIDLFRITDISVLLLQSCVVIITTVTPSTPMYQALFVLNACLWRLWYAIGLGVILHQQSNNKLWTRHFLKFGEGTEVSRLFRVIPSFTRCFWSYCALYALIYRSFWDILALQVSRRGILVMRCWVCHLEVMFAFLVVPRATRRSVTPHVAY